MGGATACQTEPETNPVTFHLLSDPAGVRLFLRLPEEGAPPQGWAVSEEEGRLGGHAGAEMKRTPAASVKVLLTDWEQTGEPESGGRGLKALRCWTNTAC